MNLVQVLCFTLANWLIIFAMDLVHLKRMIDLIQRRLGHSRKALFVVAGPGAPPDHPGHSLLPPNNRTLDSSAKYPHKNLAGNLVYGNLDKLGITYNKTNERISYSGFRRHANLLEQLFRPVENKSNRYGPKSLPTIILIKNINVRPKHFIYADNQIPDYKGDQVWDDSSDRENDAREILDIIKPATDHDAILETRRKSKIKHTNRKEYYNTDEDTSSDESDSSSSDYEKNPGNPFTVHKNRYKQNWLWNHAMTGDHMNVNPKAPAFSNLGPTGAELFYGRKWWYFNQDDYVPFR